MIYSILIGILSFIFGIWLRDKISWSSVVKGKKPIGWWYHKIMCEFWYNIKGSDSNYHKHLMIMIKKYNINLYGEIWNH